MHGEARDENGEEVQEADGNEDGHEEDDEDAKWEKYWESNEAVQQLSSHAADWDILGPQWDWTQAIFHNHSFPSTIFPGSSFDDMVRKPVKKAEEMTWTEKT